MVELTSTRSNPMIDPGLHVWGWEIPVYLFLGGLVAGMMAISGYFLFTGRYKNANCASHLLPGISLVLLSVGMLALYLDLEHKLYVWRLYTTFEIRSPMSWGSWILLLVYPALVANFLVGVPDFAGRRSAQLRAISERLLERHLLVRWIGAVNIFLGSLLGIYTGILLSGLGARPLWSSALLGPLFLVSGLSSAAALVHMIARDRDEREMLARADNGFLTIELALIGLFLIGLVTSTEAHIEAAGLFLGGPYTAVFWVFVVGVGIVLPLVIQPLAVSHRIRHTAVAPILVIVGGLLLRIVIVYAGQASHWSPI
ncbi:MAG: polysulfide reductase NrfD [bacterium]|nr:polysulfide reductase NrfD [bacterium]